MKNNLSDVQKDFVDDVMLVILQSARLHDIDIKQHGGYQLQRIEDLLEKILTEMNGGRK
jgi:metal-dependent HD superfamily phosphatase/phosphodiesterase